MTATKKTTFTIRYFEPRDMTEALDRRDQLGADIEQIQSQLGERPSDLDWRKKAKVALLCKTEELRRVKTYIREHKESENTYVKTLKTRFDTAIKVLVELDEEGLDITEEGRVLLRSVGYLPVDDDAEESDQFDSNDDMSSDDSSSTTRGTPHTEGCSRFPGPVDEENGVVGGDPSRYP